MTRETDTAVDLRAEHHPTTTTSTVSSTTTSTTTQSQAHAILQSLQHINSTSRQSHVVGNHQQQQQQDDIIQDALELLRQHRAQEEVVATSTTTTAMGLSALATTTTHHLLEEQEEQNHSLSSDHINNNNNNNSSSSTTTTPTHQHNMKRKERQERMQKYAYRLQQLKQNNNQGVIQTDMNDDNLQHPVEQVLKAMLEHSYQQYENDINKNNSQDDVDNNNKTDHNANETQRSIQQEEEDELEKVMQTLLIQQQQQETTTTAGSDDNDSFHQRIRQTLLANNNNDSTTHTSHPPSQTTTFSSQDDNHNEYYTTTHTSSSYNDDEHASSFDDERDRYRIHRNEDDDNNSSLHDDSGSSSQGSGTIESHDDDRSSNSTSDIEDDDDDTALSQSTSSEEDMTGRRRRHHKNLGPLNRKSGGTTGVVLERNLTNSTDEADNNNGAAKTKQHGPHLFDSLTNAFSYVTGTGVKSSKDHDDQQIYEDMKELVPSLCAHLIPIAIQPLSIKQDLRPQWQSEDAEEVGYRLVRLTHTQVHWVDQIMEDLLQQYREEHTDEEENATDASFERDLQAAEELLDREEEKLKHAEQSLQNAEHLDDNGDATSLPKQESLADFPGVKTVGKGEMGDLEYFHLPIIFKSHVTGFEPTKDMHLEAGNIVAGQYLVESVLGSAAFSTAYRCLDLNSEGNGPDGHEEVCLKVIKNTKDFFDQSLDEIKILELLRQTGKCDQNCVVKMKTFFYHREHLVIVTELLRQNLFEFGKFIIDHKEEPYFTIERLGYITRQCLIALRFVHSLGLVHSDVKPENILLGSYSRAKAKLIDFGSSCYLTDRQSSYIQSRSYRAPEVILGLPYDGRIDVWSVGCVVAEMYTGEVTFQNDSIVSMMSRIEAICGPFPRHMIDHGRQSKHYFTQCGLLFEKVSSRNSDDDEDEEDTDRSENDDDDDSDLDQKEDRYDIFQPKYTTWAARLGFPEEAIERFDIGLSLSKEQWREANFIDFIRKLLTVDPERRPTASEALNHPFMKYIATLTEEDILYPKK